MRWPLRAIGGNDGVARRRQKLGDLIGDRARLCERLAVGHDPAASTPGADGELIVPGVSATPTTRVLDSLGNPVEHRSEPGALVLLTGGAPQGPWPVYELRDCRAV